MPIEIQRGESARANALVGNSHRRGDEGPDIELGLQQGRINGELERTLALHCVEVVDEARKLGDWLRVARCGIPTAKALVRAAKQQSADSGTYHPTMLSLGLMRLCRASMFLLKSFPTAVCQCGWRVSQAHTCMPPPQHAHAPRQSSLHEGQGSSCAPPQRQRAPIRAKYLGGS